MKTPRPSSLTRWLVPIGRFCSSKYGLLVSIVSVTLCAVIILATEHLRHVETVYFPSVDLRVSARYLIWADAITIPIMILSVLMIPFQVRAYRKRRRT